MCGVFPKPRFCLTVGATVAPAAAGSERDSSRGGNMAGILGVAPTSSDGMCGSVSLRVMASLASSTLFLLAVDVSCEGDWELAASVSA